MPEYTIAKVNPHDARVMREIDALLAEEGLVRDKHLDVTCAAYDDDHNPVATGSLFRATLRCMAVSSAHKGEGLLNMVASFLINDAVSRGLSHLFLCTKYDTALFFKDIGFHEIASVKDTISFLENRRTGFTDYLARLKKETSLTAAHGSAVSAIVMNANPFTRGHLALVEEAARRSGVLHLFVVSEDESLFPFSVRKTLVAAGTAHLSNVVLHESGPYMISNATFPAYFQKDEEAVIRSHAALDAAVFLKIAPALGITHRYLGEEAQSETTEIYNRVLREMLPEGGVTPVIIPRFTAEGKPVSASDVRTLIHDDRPLPVPDSPGQDTPPSAAPLSSQCLAALSRLVPESTLSFLAGREALPVIERIRAQKDVIHH